MNFEVTTEEILLKFGKVFAALKVRAFEPAEERARLICFHDFVGNARDFDPLAAFLASNGVRVIAADMFGRGESAHFPDPDQYSLRRIVQGAAAVLEKYGRNATVLGCSWGGAIALLGLSLAQIRARGFIAVDLDLDFSVDTDPIIAQALADRGRTFSDRQTALDHVRANYGFDALGLDVDLSHRIRATEGGYSLSHDEASTQRTKGYSGRNFDLRRTLAAQANAVLLLQAEPSGKGMPGATLIDGLFPGGRLTLRTPLEHFLLLGYLSHSGVESRI